MGDKNPKKLLKKKKQAPKASTQAAPAVETAAVKKPIKK
jgi:hypothetical protein